MPLYEYECEACGQRFELIRKFSDSVVEVCTLCQKGPVRRLQSAPAIQFKGSGFYITDYAKPGGDKGQSDTTSGEKAADAKSDAAASAGKSEAKTETAAKADGSAKSDAPAKPASHSPAVGTTSPKD